MARKCVICDKGIQVGIKMSHSHIRTKRTWAPNLQRVKAIIDGSPRKVLVCTRCLRSGKIKRAI
jgi:large subunit ribosomal protein L28